MSPYLLSDACLDTFLLEDSPYGDATTFSLGIGRRPGTLVFRARYNMVVCGSEEAARMGTLRGLTCDSNAFTQSGTPLSAGDPILTLSGDAAALHVVWKPAQNLMESLSGIATSAAEIVHKARRINPEIGVVCTRKNFPGTKTAAIKAVLSGGATPHRLGLSETLLIFAEHRAFIGNEPPQETLARLRRAWPERQVVVEVATLEEAERWIEAGANVIQLEKCSPETVAGTVLLATGRPVRIAAAGGINADNAEAYARAGAHVLVTSAPYNAPPRDVAVTLAPA